MRPMVTVCTSINSSASAAAQVLAASIREHVPDARLLAHVRAPEIEATGWDEIVEAESMATPELLRRALEGGTAAVYLAPEMRVFGPLDPVFEALGDSGIAVVPRLDRLPDDDLLPGEGELLTAGRISPRAVAVTPGEESSRFLDWWSDRLARGDRDRPWLELAPDRFAAVTTLPDRGCNVSYWNLHERRLARGEDGTVLVDGVPLRFFDFEGFRADRPYRLSDHGTRVLVLDDPVLSELCGAYAEELRAARCAPLRRGLGDVERLGNSQRVDHLVRALWDEAGQRGIDFGDPLSAVSADAFVAWMRGPGERGGEEGVNRYLYAAYLTRPDLQQAFPKLDGPDGAGLVAWASEGGRREVILELLPTEPGGSRLASISVNVIGFLGETMGIGQAARQYAIGLAAAGVPIRTTAIRPDAPAVTEPDAIRRSGSFAYEQLTTEVEPAVNLACMNADSLVKFMHEGGQSALGARPTVGQWAWETDVLPPGWAGAAEMLAEIWVLSRFVAENLGRRVAVPVVVVPPPIVVPQPAAEPPIPGDGRFTFLFMFDFFSTPQRKNPIGLIDAFSAAFAPGDGARLVIKTINGEHRTAAAEQLRSAAAGHPDIELIHGYLTEAEKAALIAHADCYVSLHRSEGFGLTIAEAMTLGTPVIATAYSGNMDFTTAQNSSLVDWRLTKVGPECEVYPASGHWADPDLDHAAAQMLWVRKHPEAAALRAQRARCDITTAYAPKIVGEIARGRLELLSDRCGAQSRQVLPIGGRSWTPMQAITATGRRVRLRRRG